MGMSTYQPNLIIKIVLETILDGLKLRVKPNHHSLQNYFESRIVLHEVVDTCHSSIPRVEAGGH